MSTIRATEFRRVLGHLPTGVVVVTAVGPAGPVGLSINSFTSVSLHPALVGFFPAHTSGSWPTIRAHGAFCVNILAADQEPIARTFSRRVADRFAALPWTPAPHSGAPLLDGVAGWVDCTIESVTPAGDHDFVLGRVHALDADPDRRPLIFHRGTYTPYRPLPRAHLPP